MAANVDLLKRLCETPGIPGREERVRGLIESEVEGLFDAVEVDPMGSLLCRRDPRSASTRRKKTTKKTTSGTGDRSVGPTRIMIACHMDEIGFYVRHIDDNGFLRVNRAGGFDPRNLFSRRVLVCTDSGDIPGAMNPSSKPIHIATPEDRKTIPELSDFYIDTGLPAAKVKKQVRIGDYVVMHEPAVVMGDRFMSKALDNRFACWLGIEAIRALDKSGAAHSSEIHVAFTVQEEVGIRGARTSANRIQPDIGIGIDVTLACDTPGVTPENHITTLGDGVVIQLMDSSVINTHTLVREIEGVAKKNRIRHQLSMLTAGGTDTAALQMAMGGARVACLSVGTRYIHTVTEMLDVRDLEAAVKLLSAWLASAK